MQLIGCYNQAHGCRSLAKTRYECFLAWSPGWLWDNLGIRASIYNLHNPIPKAPTYLLACRCPSLILDRVMQQSRNRFVLIPAIFKHKRGHCQQMRNIWSCRPLARLTRVQPCCINQRFLEAYCKRHSVDLFFYSSTCEIIAYLVTQ